MYKLFRPLLFQIPPELMHNAVVRAGKIFSPAVGLVSGFFSYEDPILESEVCGIKFKNPVGLAAGYDKTGSAARFMAAFGLGFIEVGSVTPLPQPGSPRPRLFRLDADRAIVNRMGFNSIGMDAVAGNLKKLTKRSFIVGINLGKNAGTPNQAALRDYLAGFARLAPLVDYVVINVSSPNTPGLRQLQDRAALLEMFGALQEVNRQLIKPKPLLLKIAPDLTDAQLEGIAEVAGSAVLSGIIATNTTVSRAGLKTRPQELAQVGPGGLSGLPLRQRATEVIRYLYQRSGGSLPIIGSGGIFSAADAYEKIKAGASLVEIFTGLVYEGPGLVKKIKQGLVELLRTDGFTSIEQAVGADQR